MLSQTVLSQKSGQQTAVITLPFGINYLKFSPRVQTAPLWQRQARFRRRLVNFSDQLFSNAPGSAVCGLWRAGA